MNRPFEGMTDKEIIEKMNETELDLIDPHYQEMKQFITMMIQGKYFNTNKHFESQLETQKHHLKLLEHSEKTVKYNNMYHRAVQIKELLNVCLIHYKGNTWCYGSDETDLSKETISDTPAEATKKLVEWFGEM